MSFLGDIMPSGSSNTFTKIIPFLSPQKTPSSTLSNPFSSIPVVGSLFGGSGTSGGNSNILGTLTNDLGLNQLGTQLGSSITGLTGQLGTGLSGLGTQLTV